MIRFSFMDGGGPVDWAVWRPSRPCRRSGAAVWGRTTVTARQRRRLHRLQRRGIGRLLVRDDRLLLRDSQPGTRIHSLSTVVNTICRVTMWSSSTSSPWPIQIPSTKTEPSFSAGNATPVFNCVAHRTETDADNGLRGTVPQRHGAGLDAPIRQDSGCNDGRLRVRTTATLRATPVWPEQRWVSFPYGRS